jgi:hypothetical protein
VHTSAVSLLGAEKTAGICIRSHRDIPFVSVRSIASSRHVITLQKDCSMLTEMRRPKRGPLLQIDIDRRAVSSDRRVAF